MGILLIFSVALILKQFNINPNKKLFDEKIEEAKTNWGKKNLEEITKDEFLKLFKYIKNDRFFLFKRSFNLGINEMGKFDKIFEYQKYKILLVNKGLIFKRRDIFIFNNNEVSNVSKKTIFFKPSNLINLQGIYTSEKNIKEKDLLLKNIINKTVIDDTLGRIPKISSDVIYYNLSHAQDANLVEKRGEVLRDESKARRQNMWDN